MSSDRLSEVVLTLKTENYNFVSVIILKKNKKKHFCQHQSVHSSVKKCVILHNRGIFSETLF